jgi:methyltransferase (TIGR00027 family)
MQQGIPSRTALSAAMHRAAHQVIENGAIFTDPLAIPIIGREAATRLAEWGNTPGRRAMRLFIAARSRFAEQKLTEAVARQVVIVGAGLDTFALRNPHADVAAYEIDHPATQAWKRERIDEAGLSVPQTVRFTPVDFERQTLGEGLADSGFDKSQPAFFVWLGVVPYLTETAIFQTLGFVATVPGAEIVFDYANPPDQLAPAMRAYRDAQAERAAAVGEPWISYFDSAELAKRLTALGAVETNDLSPRDLRGDPKADDKGGHILHARWGLSAPVSFR